MLAVFILRSCRLPDEFAVGKEQAGNESCPACKTQGRDIACVPCSGEAVLTLDRIVSAARPDLQHQDGLCGGDEVAQSIVHRICWFW